MQSSPQREAIRDPREPPKNQAMSHKQPAWVSKLSPKEREERAAVIASKGTRSLNRLVQVTQPPAPVAVRWFPEPVTIPESAIRILGVCADAAPEVKAQYEAAQRASRP